VAEPSARKQGRYNKRRYLEEKRGLETGDDVEPYVANVVDAGKMLAKRSGEKKPGNLPAIGQQCPQSQFSDPASRTFATELHDQPIVYSKNYKQKDHADNQFYSPHSKSQQATHRSVPPATQGAVPMAQTPRSSKGPLSKKQLKATDEQPPEGTTPVLNAY
jgi:hypothetical protein